MALAALDGRRDAVYLGEGGSASTLDAAAHRAGSLLWRDDLRGNDPMLWPADAVERLWKNVAASIGVKGSHAELAAPEQKEEL